MAFRNAGFSRTAMRWLHHGFDFHAFIVGMHLLA